MNEPRYSQLTGINLVNRHLAYCFNNRVEPKTLLTEPKPTPPAHHLRKLPREIRQQIFSHVIEWHGKTPNLIKGLRARIDSEVYKDAIHVLKRQCTFELSRKNYKSRLEMGQAAWDNIESLSMHYWDENLWSFSPIPTPLLLKMSLEKLHFDMSEKFHIDGDLFDAAQACRYFLDHFKSIKELSVTVALFPLTPGEWREQVCSYDIALGVGSEFTHEIGEDLHMMSLGLQMRMWNALKGSTLSWNEEAYWGYRERESVKHAK